MFRKCVCKLDNEVYYYPYNRKARRSRHMPLFLADKIPEHWDKPIKIITKNNWYKNYLDVASFRDKRIEDILS